MGQVAFMLPEAHGCCTSEIADVFLKLLASSFPEESKELKSWRCRNFDCEHFMPQTSTWQYFSNNHLYEMHYSKKRRKIKKRGANYYIKTSYGRIAECFSAKMGISRLCT